MRRRAVAAGLAAMALCCATRIASGQGGEEEAKNEARIRFERGLALFDQSLWAPALTEFQASREKFRTRNSTKNAAICLRILGRFEEALELFETFRREFPTAPEEEKRLVESEIRQLNDLVATVTLMIAEAGATIVVDDRERGSSPLTTALRLSTGEHKISVYKSGFAPWERRIAVAGKTSARVDVDLRPLGAAGRLTVTEAGGATAGVVVDNVTVGKTPWEGSVAPGNHVVWLSGEARNGSQPALIAVKVNESASIALPLELLPSELFVRVAPPQAQILVDGVAVAAGTWQGRVRSGSHRLEVGLPGFLPVVRTLVLSANERVDQNVSLERDPDSPLWQTSRPAHVTVEASIGTTAFFVSGGDVRDGCTGNCSGGMPLGWSARAYVGYELPRGFGLAVFGGYARFGYTTSDRATVARPVGRPTEIPAVVRDDVVVSGVMAGVSPFLRMGETWPLTARVDAAVVFGRAYDDRSGVSAASSTVTLPPATTSRAATHVLLAPSFEIARRFQKRLDIGVRASLTFLYVPTLPTTGVEAFGTENATLGKGAGETYLGGVLFGGGLDLGARWLF